MRKLSLDIAKAQYVNRYTLEHVPQWARARCEGNGRAYAPQFRTDSEWYDNTTFPGEGDLSGRSEHCETRNQTWPLGQWLARPLPADLARKAAHCDLSLAALRDVLEWEEVRHAARWLERWPAAPKGYRVACYNGDWNESPVIYTQAACFDHRTLAAACRRLATLIHRRKPDCPRFDCLYIVTPEGARLPLKAARERLAADG